MDGWLKQSTVFTDRIGPVLDASGVEYNGLVIGDLSRTKNGTTTVMATSTLTYDANGYYSLTTIAGDSDTLGRLVITCNKSTYQMPPRCYMVLTAATYDALVTNAWNAANGGGDIKLINGVSTSPVTTIAANIGSASAFSGTSLSGSVGSVTGSVGSVTGSVGSISGVSFPSNFSSFSVDASGRVLLQPSQPSVTIPTVTNTGTVTGNVNGSVASVTGNVGGNVSGSIASVVGAVGSVTGSVGSVTNGIGGDVSGKVLGGGAGTISGDGVRASSVSGSVASVTGSVGSVTGSVGSVAGNVSGDVNGKVLGGGASAISGAGVRADSVTGSVGSVTGAVGSVTGSIGSISGISFPTYFGSLVISASGIVSANAAQFGGTSTTGILTSTGVFAVPALANAPSVSGPTLAQIQAGLFVDGGTNKLKVNADNSVTASGGGVTVYVTVPSPVAQASIVAAQITAVRGDTLQVTLPLMGTISTRSNLVFTVKVSSDDVDSAAIIQIAESGGLITLNGASASSSAWGSLSVTNATTGAVNLTLKGPATAQLAVRDLVWDCQWLDSSSPPNPNTPIAGGFSVVGDVTRAVT